MKQEKIFVLFDPNGKPDFNTTGYYSSSVKRKAEFHFATSWGVLKYHGYRVKSLIINYEL